MVALPRRRDGAVQSSAGSNQINLASAKEIWAQAIRLDPPSPSQSFVKLQRLLCRLQGLHEPVLTTSETSYLHVNVGLLLAYLGETALAAQSFQQAVESDKYSAIAWHALGGMAFLLGMWPEAGEAWRQCWHCFGSQQQSIIYHMCKIGGGCAFSESENREREWELQKTRVEWSMRFAYSNDGWQREYMQERLWNINGVPCGLLFGPSFSIDCSYFNNGQGHPGAASANLLQHNSTGTRESNLTTPKYASNFTKPLPHLPSVAGSATSTIRPQKTFLPRWPLFKIRALSPDKSKSHQHKLPERSTTLHLTGNIMAPCPVLRRPARGPPAAKIGGLFSSKCKFFETSKHRLAATCDNLVENTFHTDSESESDEEGYYLPTRPVPKLDVQHFFAKPVHGASNVRAYSPGSSLPANFGQVEISSPNTRTQSPSAQNEVRKPIQVDTIVEDEEWNIVATSYSHPSAASIGSISPPLYPLRSSSILYLLRGSQQPDPSIEIEVPKSDPPERVTLQKQQGAKSQVPARKLNRIENIILGTERHGLGLEVSARKPNRIENILLEKRSQNSPTQAVSQMLDRVCTSLAEDGPSLYSSSNTREKHRSESSITDRMSMEITVMLDQSCFESYRPEYEATESRGRSEKRQKPAERESAKLGSLKQERPKIKPAKPEPAKLRSTKPGPAKPEPDSTKRELTKPRLEQPRASRSKPVRMVPAARGAVKSKIARWEESVKVDATETKPKRSSLATARPATSQSPTIQAATIQPATTQSATTQSAIQPQTAQPATSQSPTIQTATIQPATTQSAIPQTAQQANATSRKIQLKKRAAHMKSSVPEAGGEILNPVRFEGFAGEWRALDLIYEAEQKLKESQIWNSETSQRVRFVYSSSGWRALDPECQPSRRRILNSDIHS